MKNLERFYVGSTAITNNSKYPLKTLEAATEQARQLTSADGVTRHVVEVIRRVIRTTPPTIVEEI